MNIEMNAAPVFRFALTDAQLGVLIKCSSHHYDGVCQAASRVGGFIYGWNNSMEFHKEQNDGYLPCKASWGDIDCCMKILEGVHVCSEDERRTAEEIRCAFIACFNAAREKIHNLSFSIEYNMPEVVPKRDPFAEFSPPFKEVK